jgi:hypothetical protein
MLTVSYVQLSRLGPTRCSRPESVIETLHQLQLEPRFNLGNPFFKLRQLITHASDGIGRYVVWFFQMGTSPCAVCLGFSTGLCPS